MPANLDGLLWLLALIGPLLIFQRNLHREIQAIFLIITRRPDVTLALFSLLFFPGILLHEGSHYLMARLLGVRTGRFSIVPRPVADGRLQLGFVETASSDWLRDALIGAAPLLAGGLFVGYVGLARLGLIAVADSFAAAGIRSALSTFSELPAQPDFWLWFYLTLVVSSTMLPSASDRRAWLPLGMVVVVLLCLSIIAGGGPWLVTNLALPLNRILQAVAVVFGISVLVHMILLAPLWIVRSILTWLMGVQVG